MLLPCIAFLNILVTVCSFLTDRNSLSLDHGVYLTPLINKGHLEEAVKLSRVDSLIEPSIHDVISHAGYFTIDTRYNSNIFHWFFQAEVNFENAPIIMWFNGGPGISSLYNALFDKGPYEVLDNGKLKLRETRWTKTISMLFIDSPVGGGYSFSDHDDGYPTNEKDLSTHLYEVARQFFTLYPNLKKNDFYVASGFYGGKYSVAFANYIDSRKASQKHERIDLKGLIMTDVLIDPLHTMNYGEFLHQFGLIDENGKHVFNVYENKIVSLIQEGKLEEATEIFNHLMLGCTGSSIFQNLTGFQSTNDLLKFQVDGPKKLEKFIQSNYLRNKIHAGNHEFHNMNRKVLPLLKATTLKTEVNSFQDLLNKNYKVLVVSFQMDMLMPYVTTEKVLINLQWNGAEEYRRAQRLSWKINNDLIGYVKFAKNLREVMVRNLGRTGPFGETGYRLINAFIFNNQSFVEKKNNYV